jgi:CBS domain-containing protein
MKARDVMSGGLITCSPDAPVAEAAQLMRDRDTGDVLVTNDGKLLGIVTDRDIAVRAAAAGADASQVPVRKYMSKHLVTGHPNWDLDHVAKTMSKNQIRRLPIIENGMLLGIISLGDVALRDRHKDKIAQSLRAISEPTGVRKLRRGRSRLLRTMGLAVLVGAVVAFTMSPKSMSNMVERAQDNWDRMRDNWDRFQESETWDNIVTSLEKGRDRLSDLTS